MGVNDVEAAVGFRTMLPDWILTWLRRSEQFVEEMRHSVAGILEMGQSLGIVPTKNILEAATLKPHLIRLLFLEYLHINVGAYGLRAGTLLNQIDVLLGLSIVTGLQAALGIVEQHLGIAHDNDVVQAQVAAVLAAILDIVRANQHLERQVEGSDRKVPG